MRFFEDDSLAEEVALTEEQIKFFDDLEWKITKMTGYSKLSGGHCMIIIQEEREEFLDFDVMVGVEGEHLTLHTQMWYNRDTKECKEQ